MDTNFSELNFSKIASVTFLLVEGKSYTYKGITYKSTKPVEVVDPNIIRTLISCSRFSARVNYKKDADVNSSIDEKRVGAKMKMKRHRTERARL